MKKKYEKLKLEVISFDTSERVMMSGASEDTGESSKIPAMTIGPADTIAPENLDTY